MVSGDEVSCVVLRLIMKNKSRVVSFSHRQVLHEIQKRILLLLWGKFRYAMWVLLEKCFKGEHGLGSWLWGVLGGDCLMSFEASVMIRFEH